MASHYYESQDYVEILNDVDWMFKEKQDQLRTFDNSVRAIIDSFKEIKRIVKPIIDSGANAFDYFLCYTDIATLSNCCTVVYNECQYLIDYHSAKYNDKKLYYLKCLRNLCAHNFGSTMDYGRFQYSVVRGIIPMEGSIKSMLLESLDSHKDSEISRELVLSMNRKKRWHFWKRDRIHV